MGGMDRGDTVVRMCCMKEESISSNVIFKKHPTSKPLRVASISAPTHNDFSRPP